MSALRPKSSVQTEGKYMELKNRVPRYFLLQRCLGGWIISKATLNKSGRLIPSVSSNGLPVN